MRNATLTPYVSPRINALPSQETTMRLPDVWKKFPYHEGRRRWPPRSELKIQGSRARKPRLAQRTRLLLSISDIRPTFARRIDCSRHGSESGHWDRWRQARGSRPSDNSPTRHGLTAAQLWAGASRTPQAPTRRAPAVPSAWSAGQTRDVASPWGSFPTSLRCVLPTATTPSHHRNITRTSFLCRQRRITYAA